MLKNPEVYVAWMPGQTVNKLFLHSSIYTVISHPSDESSPLSRGGVREKFSGKRITACCLPRVHTVDVSALCCLDYVKGEFYPKCMSYLVIHGLSLSWYCGIFGAAFTH